MNLYSEEQVLNALRLAHSHIKPLQYVVDTLKSIELPTDEEIRKESHDYFMRGQLGFEAAADTERAFLRGVLWMREQIQKGKK